MKAIGPALLVMSFFLAQPPALAEPEKGPENATSSRVARPFREREAEFSGANSRG